MTCTPTKNVQVIQKLIVIIYHLLYGSKKSKTAMPITPKHLLLFKELINEDSLKNGKPRKYSNGMQHTKPAPVNGRYI